MLRHLAPLVVRHRHTTLGIDSVKNHTEVFDRCLSTTSCNLGQGYKQTCSFNERADSRSISATFNQITTPSGQVSCAHPPLAVVGEY